MSSIMPIQQSHSSKRGFPIWLFAAAFVASLLTTVFSTWQSWQMHTRFEEMSAKHLDIAEKIGRIMLLDEMLTMSARMAAATGDFSYEKRYDQFDPELTALINDVRANLPQAEIARFIGETDAANLALVKLERQAFALTHQGRRQEATVLLTSDEYMRLKKVYAGGMEKTTDAEALVIERDDRHLHSLTLFSAVVSAMGILLLLVTWFFAARSVRSWATERREVEDALQKVRDELEVRVKQRTADLLSANQQLQHEIAEHKQTVESLRKLSLAVEQSPSSVVITDLNANIEYANAAFTKTTGYSLAEVIGQNSRILHSGKTPKATYDDMWAHLKRSEVWKGEFINRRKDGGEFIESVLMSPVRQADGSVTHYLAIKEDITIRKLAQETLRVSRENLHRLLNSMGEGAYGVDIHGDCTFVNQAFLQMLGYQNDGEVLGKHIHELIHHSHVDGSPYPDSECRMYRAYRTNQTSHVSDEVFWRKDGVAIPVEYWSRPIETDGVVIGAIVTFIDITERKLAEDNLAANEALLKEFIRHTPAAIAMLDTQMRYIQNSEQWIRDYHLSSQDIVGKSHYEIFPDLPQRWRDIHQRALAGATERCDEDQFLRADGSIEWLQWEVRPWHKAGGEIGGVIFFTQVITERKQDEAKLAEQLEELRRWNEVTSGREGRILDLKHEVNDLLSETGKQPRYPSAESQDTIEEKS